MSALGKRVRQARKAAELSQAELAEKIGVKQPTIADLESGESKGTRYLLEIARITGVSPDWLSTGRGAIRARDPLVEEFAALPEETKRAVLAMARALRNPQVA